MKKISLIVAILFAGWIGFSLLERGLAAPAGFFRIAGGITDAGKVVALAVDPGGALLLSGQALAAANVSGFVTPIAGVTDGGVQVPLLVDGNGGLYLSGSAGGGLTNPLLGTFIVDAGDVSTLTAHTSITDQGPFTATTIGGTAITGSTSLKAGTSTAVTSIGIGPDCTMAATTTCTVTTVGGTAASHCFMSQTTGTLATLPCECASGTNSCVITCGAATSGNFSCLLLN